jgi:hypothetical protein
MRKEHKSIPLLLASTALTMSAPLWGATMDANIEAFLTSSDFNLVSSDVQLRFTELAPADGTNNSTHILIDGLVPVESGSDVLTSNYRGIDIATGDEYDVGQVTLTLPSGASTSGASSPIVGIVARNTPTDSSGWSAYATASLSGTDIGGSTGTIDIDTTTSGTMTFAMTSPNGALTGTANYTVVDENTIDVEAFDLTDPSGTYGFAPMTLVMMGSSYYGVMMSTTANLPDDYDSLMYTLRIGASDADTWGGYSVTTNPDGSRWADATGDWYGYLNIDNDPFLYSFEMDVWMFMPEPSAGANGAWGYIFKKGAASPVAGWGGYPITVAADGNNWVDGTGNWYGWIMVQNAPVLYSLSADIWMFMNEPAGDANGAWAYGFKN